MTSELSVWLAIIHITMATKVATVTKVTIATKEAWGFPTQLLANAERRR